VQEIENLTTYMKFGWGLAGDGPMWDPIASDEMRFGQKYFPNGTGGAYLFFAVSYGRECYLAAY